MLQFVNVNNWICLYTWWIPVLHDDALSHAGADVQGGKGTGPPATHPPKKKTKQVTRQSWSPSPSGCTFFEKKDVVAQVFFLILFELWFIYNTIQYNRYTQVLKCNVMCFW